MANFLTGIISLAISVVVLATVFISTVKTTNTSTFTTSEVSMWGLITLVAIVGKHIFNMFNVNGLRGFERFRTCVDSCIGT